MGHPLESADPPEACVLLFPIVRNIVTTIIVPDAVASNPTRTGGCFAFWRKDDAVEEATLVVCFQVGKLSAERTLKYIHFANEKAARLSRNPTHVSSFQSRDVSDRDKMNHKYGGAIRCGDSNLFFAFSGFSEIEDERICSFAALDLKLIDQDFVNRQINDARHPPLAGQ